MNRLRIGGERGGDGDGAMLMLGSDGTTGSTKSASECSSPTPPGVGLRPSRNAFAISAAFHLEYLILSSVYDYVSKGQLNKVWSVPFL